MNSEQKEGSKASTFGITIFEYHLSVWSNLKRKLRDRLRFLARVTVPRQRRYRVQVLEPWKSFTI
jgi:hypothetical protein